MAQSKIRHRLTLAARILAGVIAAVFVILFIASMWLLGPSGQILARDLIAGIVSDGVGYELEAKDVELDLPISIAIGELTVADDEGVWLSADDVTISVLPSFDLLNSIIIPDAKALAILVKRQPLPPKRAESDGGGGGMDISIPDLRIGKLTLAPEVTGLEDALDTSIVGDVGLASDDGTLDFSLIAEIDQGLPALSAARLDVEGIFQLNDNLLFIDAASLGSEAIDASASGRLNTETLRVDLDLKATSENLSVLIADLAGALDAEIKMTGDVTAPTLDAVFTSRDLIYQNRAVPDSRLSIGAQPEERNWSGQIDLEAGELATAKSPFTWRGDTLSFSRFSIADKFGEISGTIDIDTTNFLANGDIIADLPQLEIYQELLPITVGGALSGTAKLSPKDGKQSLSLDASAVSLSIADVQVESSDVTASFSDVLSILPDSLTAKFAQLRWGETQIQTGTLSAERTHETWQVRSQARGRAGQPFDLNITGSGAFTDAQTWQATVTSLKGTVGDRLVATSRPATINSTPDNQTLQVGGVTFGGGQFSLNATRQGDSIQGDVNGNNVSLKTLGIAPAPEWDNAVGTLQGTFGGTLVSPTADATFDLQGLRLTNDGANGRAKIIASLRQGQARTKINVTDGTAIRSRIEASLPLGLSLQPFAFELPDTAPLQGTVNLNLDITALAKLALPPDQKLTGRANGELVLGGTVSQPALRGQIQFRGGSFEYVPVGLNLRKIQFDLEANGKVIAIRDFRASDPAGNPLNADGAVTLEAVDTFAYNMSIKGDQMELLAHPNAIGTLSLDLQAEGTESEGKLSGTLTSQSMAIQLPDQFVETVPELNVVETVSKDGTIQDVDTDPEAYRLALDMTLKADNKVFVRGWGLDAELQGNLAIKGEADDPQVTGKLSTVRGRYEEFGKQLELTKAEIIFEGDMPPSPFLDIVGTTSVSNTAINLNITGPLQDPDLGISSSPTLPEDEALSLLLFGSGVANISALQAVQLANSLRRFSGVGPGGPSALGRIRNTIGVDNLTLKSNGDDAADAALGVGKYIGDNIYLEIEQGLEAGSGKAKIEVDVTDSISVESGTSVSGDQNIGINWKRDY